MMKHEHGHCHCDHALKVCGHCDVVYCTKCSMEWKKPGLTWTYSQPNPWYTSTGTWTSQLKNNQTSGYIATANSHQHE